MALILNIDTATEVCSVCLAKDGEVLSIQENNELNTHAAVITILIDKLFTETGLNKRDLNAVAISSGPGSYTGLRIGTSIAKGICYSLGIPLISVPTLHAMAFGAQEVQTKFGPSAEYFCPMMDARRNEVYMAIYDKDLQEIEPVQPLIIDDEEVLLKLTEEKDILFSGTGADKFSEIFIKHKINYLQYQQHTAKNMTILSFNNFFNKNFKDIAYFEPVYLKLFDKIINK